MVDSPNDVNLRYSALLVLDLFLTVSIQMIGFAPRQIMDASQSISSDGASPALVAGYNPGQNSRTCESGEIASDSPASIRLFMRSDHRRAPSVAGSLEPISPDEVGAGFARLRTDRQTAGDGSPGLSVVAVSAGPRNVAVGAVGPRWEGRSAGSVADGGNVVPDEEGQNLFGAAVGIPNGPGSLGHARSGRRMSSGRMKTAPSTAPVRDLSSSS